MLTIVLYIQVQSFFISELLLTVIWWILTEKPFRIFSILKSCRAFHIHSSNKMNKNRINWVCKQQMCFIEHSWFIYWAIGFFWNEFHGQCVLWTILFYTIVMTSGTPFCMQTWKATSGFSLSFAYIIKETIFFAKKNLIPRKYVNG